MVALKQVRLSTHSAATFSLKSRENLPQRNRSAAHFSQSLQRARYYDPSTAEFTSRDPLEYVDGLSVYRGYFGFVGIDVFGTDCELVFGVIARAPGGPIRLTPEFRYTIPLPELGVGCSRVSTTAVASSIGFLGLTPLVDGGCEGVREYLRLVIGQVEAHASCETKCPDGMYCKGPQFRFVSKGHFFPFVYDFQSQCRVYGLLFYDLFTTLTIGKCCPNPVVDPADMPPLEPGADKSPDGGVMSPDGKPGGPPERPKGGGPPERPKDDGKGGGR